MLKRGAMPRIVTLVGMPGSGKTEAAKFFTGKGFQYLRFGQIVLDEAIKRGKVNEDTEREIRNAFRRRFGKGAMAILNLDKLKELLSTGSVVVDGLYSWEEYKVLKKKFGDRLVIVAVVASPKIRYSRLMKRKFDPERDRKAQFRPMTRQEAKSRDYDQIENADQGGPIAMADFYLVNDGNKSELNLLVVNLLKSIP